MLIEPGHPANTYAGALTTGAQLPNILTTKATALIGGPTGAKFLITSQFSGAQGRVERSSKGGIHFLQTQTDSVLTRSARVNLQNLNEAGGVRDYLIANPTHNVFLGAWSRVTRAAVHVGTTTLSRAQLGTTWANLYNRASAQPPQRRSDDSHLRRR